ncbi:MAG: MarR family EPS-associated transcriptional regulator [Paracoccaceae bacterium]
MASQREQQQQERHFKVMRLLDEDPSISTRLIAQKVGISNGGAYYCVKALVEKGFVKLKNFTKSKTKAKYIYELTPHGIREKAALTVSFLERKRQEYDDLKLEIEHLENELAVDKKKCPIIIEVPCDF